MHTSDIDASRSINSTIVRTSCERGAISAAVGLGSAAEVYGYAVVVARHATSERHLAAFIRDQIDGRETAVEAAIAAAHPDYAMDVAFKITLFTLGLLVCKGDQGTRVEAALRKGDCVIDVRLSEASVSVRITGSGDEYLISYPLSDADGNAVKVH
ncbi:hypothetical protein SOW02_18410 [Pectobacterium actinidiae]|uniref:hypothetical protein n=1 Tax=Pectobacterium actinidiae TaxID=1507808 RepID=UPI002A814200|nr:hypothetical protein [Pectobacterium actinidiae]MDY4316891.1 hypothetical protein [Pectobacterium actinidiae]